MCVVLVRTIWSCVCWAKFQSIPEDASFGSTGRTVCRNTTDDIFSAGCKKIILGSDFHSQISSFKEFWDQYFLRRRAKQRHPHCSATHPEISPTFWKFVTPTKNMQIRIICRATSHLSCEKRRTSFGNNHRILSASSHGEVPHRMWRVDWVSWEKVVIKSKRTYLTCRGGWDWYIYIYIFLYLYLYYTSIINWQKSNLLST